MKIKTHGILELCIEQGIETALGSFSPCPNNSLGLSIAIEKEIWLLLDKMLDFDDEFPNT
jgi:hypothetical protein